ncbi:MAG: XRE family transcriptional regulator, partial [Alphaproteobacteria bacterium]
METWRDRARRRMKERGVTQDSLAEQLGITQGGLQHWLAGSRQPSLDQINKIADALDASHAWLTHGVESNDSLDGLGDAARNTLRRFISAERQGLLHAATWRTLSSLADVALAQADNTQNKPLGAPLN